jgi:hypothetical protein
MNLDVKNDVQEDETQNFVPLGNDEIKSILKKQSETVFEEKNISSKTEFIKKSLIDIALDFEAKSKNDEQTHIENKTAISEQVDEVNVENNKEENNNTTIDTKEASKVSEVVEEETLVNVDENLTNSSNTEDEDIEINNNEIKENVLESNEEDNSSEDKSSEILKAEEQNSKINIPRETSQINTENNENDNGEETKKALNSVRDAVSQSMNNLNNVVDENLEINNLNASNSQDTISKDYEKFQNIFSNLSNLAEDALYDVIKKKIVEIAYDLAGYQIDQMPEKYEKKIKSLLKNINCFEDKITIEVNEDDHVALSKLEKFSDGLDKSIFVPNKDLLRGDIILNCDGMNYSEKSINK